ncbi:hypothetical protein THTE_2503 [Thermogutta terrifontis]|uniref:Uncharacterized protein n=1 Tax=Thermogutta terrifontis TaxID=1331910 RepID=A0A286RGL0_9BACT|nr:hypothetical protein THTE_2503 [Thermogutta terrifontis]
MGGNGISERFDLPRVLSIREVSAGVGKPPGWDGVITGAGSGKPAVGDGTEGVSGGAGGPTVPGPDTALLPVTWADVF